MPKQNNSDKNNDIIPLKDRNHIYYDYNVELEDGKIISTKDKEKDEYQELIKLL